jgi:hypothetical protein
MTIQAFIISDWREANRGERAFGFADLIRRYEEIGVDVAAQLDRIVQPARDCRPSEKNAVDATDCERANDFSSGCVNHERLRSATLCCVDSRD